MEAVLGFLQRGDRSVQNKQSCVPVATFITLYIGLEALEIHNSIPFYDDNQKGDINKVLLL